ncbi:MAG: nucleoside triphosphate pyrophosphohydrolase, partial [Gemmatimonadota bacterium]
GNHSVVSIGSTVKVKIGGNDVSYTIVGSNEANPAAGRISNESPLGRAVGMVADLRERCSWDRIQTRQTLRPYLIEEAHELAAALGADDPVAIRGEVADLMLHLAWQLVLGAEHGEFTPDDIADDLVAKMRRRHPHLFDLGESAGWEELKRRESAIPRGTLDGLPATLPELLLAYRLQERAAEVGFDWPDVQGPLDKIREELAEVEEELVHPAPSADRLRDEIGDLLFAVVNLARKANVSPGAALERSNAKFRDRFAEVERIATERNVKLGEATLEELDVIWDEVKRKG